MGEHRSNPRAIAAAAAQPRFRPGDEVYGFELETVIEVNAEKMAELNPILERVQAEGRDPRTVPELQLDSKEHPEWFDLVVYNRINVGRPSVLLAMAQGIPTARVRWNEHLRVPLVSLRERAEMAFAGAEAAQGASH